MRCGSPRVRRTLGWAPPSRWVVSLVDRRIHRVGQIDCVNGQAEFSPGGRWMSYTSGAPNRVFVQPFPAPGAIGHVSRPGLHSFWSRHGTKRFFARTASDVFAVRVTTRPTLSIGDPVRVRPGTGVAFRNGVTTTPAMADSTSSSRPAGAAPPPTVQVIITWSEELNGRLPAKSSALSR
jgi:hypothetical protein